MIGISFSEYQAPKDNRTQFEKLKDLFLELLLHASGDVDEALDWMTMLDEEHGLFSDDYTFEDFKKDLFKENIIQTTGQGNSPTPKTEKAIRSKALEDVFGKIKRAGVGDHNSKQLGKGDEALPETRPYQFGDAPQLIDYSSSFKNALTRNYNQGDFNLTEEDLEVRQTAFKAQMSTVVMIDISHSMILYGEDRITPAKKVALALAEYINRRYPKDHVEFVVFGNDAWKVSLKDLPYLQVGPYHTNTVAGLELAMDLLRRKKESNKQIFMITDGKPTCLKEGDQYYKNSMGHDPKIISKCLNLAIQCRKLKIPITTFMIANDPYLQSFVEEFTEANKGKAFFSGLNGLADMVFKDYENNRKKNTRF
ncbi:vWA domain-containing protein [Luteibaculum oceani]|uniref:VWFA domain-containing protein n=1 Tax=Luteibaculum oceani TaxID=1294296 RepID=A0A5C6VA87_9FLAO|nr:hypothetical protein [Luteibaculum oceani]TXC82159.1 hypothetical protein FRX97_03430 [Luteibaculum oceani]